MFVDSEELLHLCSAPQGGTCRGVGFTGVGGRGNDREGKGQNGFDAPNGFFDGDDESSPGALPTGAPLQRPSDGDLIPWAQVQGRGGQAERAGPAVSRAGLRL